MQRLAVEESRLRIPLLIGLDIIHGHRTLFPIPLAETALFDPRTWERTAREAATEAAHDGSRMTFAPMLDVSRDTRWGRRRRGPARIRGWPCNWRAPRCAGFRGAISASVQCTGRLRQALLRLRPVTGGPRICVRGHLRAHAARGASAALRGGRAGRSRHDHAGLHRSRRHSDDGNTQLLRIICASSWDSRACIVSDYNAIGELMRHGIAADLAEAARTGAQGRAWTST